MRELLAPHTDPLNAAEFDAFICYAHGEMENAAAEALRDSLERYRDSVFGERKIRRVFLDEGELSSCADYGESINAALANSKRLIVLLSERAKQSRWVGEEIRTFLAHHDKSLVLAVLLEGEPSEVFPEALTKGGLTADNLLAADARADDRKQMIGKIKGDVTLRIAAPILSTTYESLKQRVRMYRMKRGFTAAAVTLCALAGFFAYAAVKANRIAEQERQIAEQQSLIAEKARKEADMQREKQADLLAAQAQDFYNKKDYTKAAESALASLELTEGGCSRRSALKKILLECLNLYVQPEEARFTVVPTGVFREETGVSPDRCFLSSDGSRLFMVCGRRVSVWDTADCRMVSAYDSGAELSEQMRAGRENLLNEKNGQLIIWSDRELVCFGYETGEVVWRKEFEKDVLRQVLVHAGRGSVYDMYYSDQRGQAVVEERRISDGELSGEHVFDTKDRNKPFGFDSEISDDGRYIAGIGSASAASAGQAEMALRIYDLRDNVLTECAPEAIDPWGSYMTENVLFAQGGRILASKYDGPVNIRSYADGEHYTDRIGAKNFRISCYDAGSGGKIWSYAESDTDLRGLWAPQVLPVQVEGADAVAAAVGNTVLVLDAEDGGCLFKIQLDAVITYWDRTKDAFRFVLNDGEVLYVPKTLDMQEVLSARSLPADSEVMCADETSFYVAGDAERGTVIRYERGRADDSYVETEEVDGIDEGDGGDEIGRHADRGPKAESLDQRVRGAHADRERQAADDHEGDVLLGDGEPPGDEDELSVEDVAERVGDRKRADVGPVGEPRAGGLVDGGRLQMQQADDRVVGRDAVEDGPAEEEDRHDVDSGGEAADEAVLEELDKGVRAGAVTDELAPRLPDRAGERNARLCVCGWVAHAAKHSTSGPIAQARLRGNGGRPANVPARRTGLRLRGNAGL